MRSSSIARVALVVCPLSAALLHCEPPLQGVGISTAPHAVATESRDAATPTIAPFAPPDDTVLAVLRHATTEHFAGECDIEVYASRSALEALKLTRGSFPEGSVIVARHVCRGPDKQGAMSKEGPRLEMRKSGDAGNAWTFTDRGGSIQKSDGVSPKTTCADCHQEAPRDFVFSKSR